MALLGLLLLPSNFRAGGEATHGHSLIQLWADAADGQMDHHLHHHQTDAPLMNWLDPSLESTAQSAPATDEIDIGSHDDSTPVPGAVHFLPVMLALFIAFVGERLLPFPKEMTLVGCCSDVLLPPPR